MSHALSVGIDLEVPGTHGRICDGCGFVTFVDVDDADAHWVYCGWCQRRRVAGERWR